MNTKILFLVLVLFGSLSQTSSDAPKYIVQLNPKEGKKLLKQCSRPSPKRAKNYFYIQDSTLNILKEEFYKIKEIKSSFNSYIKDLDNYAYQVIGFEIKREAYIYINAFPIGGKNPDDVKAHWKELPIVICDGGHSYWGIVFNIKKREFSDLHRNGPGPVFIE